MATSTRPLHPISAVSHTNSQADIRWADLVRRISALPGSDLHAMALRLMLRRLQRKAGHRHYNPFCATCANQALAMFGSSERELLDLFYASYAEVVHTRQSMLERNLARRQGRQRQASAA